MIVQEHPEISYKINIPVYNLFILLFFFIFGKFSDLDSDLKSKAKNIYAWSGDNSHKTNVSIDA